MKRHSCITLIIILAFILRFYQLGSTPLSLEWDEVAIGYDAYSILKTGRDQFGQFLPLTFRSLDDWKPPIYEYVTVPAVLMFGLNEFSVRLPSAIFGLLAVFLTYLLSLEIFSPLKIRKSLKIKLALLSSFLLAISPWHLQFSRVAFEVNLSVAITIAAVTFFIKGLKENKYFIFSALLFGVNLFSYHSSRVITPLMVFSLFVFLNRRLPAKKNILVFLSIFTFFFVSFIPILFSPEAQIRLQATNIFKAGARYLDEKDLDKLFLEKRLTDKDAGFEIAGKIFHNRRLFFLDEYTLKKAFRNYISNFNFDYLFINGDAPLHHAPGFGHLYIIESPFLILGLLIFIFNIHRLDRNILIIFIWLLIAPLPNAVTREAPHSVRTELILPMYQLLTAVGLISFFSLLKKESSWVKMLFLTLISLGFVINHSFYLHQYYVHTNYELADKWLYGRKEAVEITEELKSAYDKVLVSLNVDMPYIFWLFYTQYPPDKYLKKGGTVSGGFADQRNRFDKYEFRNFNFNSLPLDQRLLLVSIPNDFPSDAKILRTIYYPNGKAALVIAENKLF